MNQSPIQVSLLQKRIRELESEIERLRHLLKLHGITEHDNLEIQENICSPQITAEHARLLYSYFKGRKDVFSLRNVNKEGKGVYYPVCEHFWVQGKCPRRDGVKIRCMDCKNRKWIPLSQRVLMRHLKGESEEGRDVVGVYPLLENETCHFLVFDFDNHDDSIPCDWRAEVDALRNICKQLSVDALVEISRSGNGAHVWIFFEEAISALEARKFGFSLLTQGAELVNQKTFLSYDRMLPAQDHLTEGGLGNLIALPLQGRALRNNCSAFVDENWRVYNDQWGCLKNTRRLSLDFVKSKISEWGSFGLVGELSSLSDDDHKPWANAGFALQASDIEGAMHIVESGMLYIRTDNLKPRLCNKLRRLASFSNPLYHRHRAMGLSVKGLSRIIPCYREEMPYLILPRGKKIQLWELLQQANISVEYEDVRALGNFLPVQFVAQLYPEQQLAANAILEHENGILHAATAFGKTAVGAYLIAARQVNTLVLVHNREILKNWVEDLSKFLQIDSPLPQYETPSGRKKVRKKHVGCLYAAHDSIGGLVDVVMISSLGTEDMIHSLVKNYGMVIMDECHHGAAYQAEQVLNTITSKYVYGLTATPKRDDGMDQKLLMLFGPIRYRFTARQRAEMQNIHHLLYPRFTQFCSWGENWKIHEVYKNLIIDPARNQLIIQDVISCVAQRRTPLILTKFKSHAKYLHDELIDKANHVYLLQGGIRTKEREKLRSTLLSTPPEESVIVIATGQYIGEGFNYPRLDTLMLATPISWEGNVEQYAGRLHRNYAGKNDVIIYDYVDVRLKMLDTMYTKRLKTYKRMGYSMYVPGPLFESSQNDSFFYDADELEYALENDLLSAQQEILISSPFLSKKGASWLLSFVSGIISKGIRVVVLTLSPSVLMDRKTEVEKIHHYLQVSGIQICSFSKHHECFVAIDKELLWYGNANCLSARKSTDHMMRMKDCSIVANLLDALSVKLLKNCKHLTSSTHSLTSAHRS